MKTNISREEQLDAITGHNLPFIAAADWYLKHSGLNFRDDLCHYHLFGYVGCTPGFFLMGKMIMLEGEPAFFVRFASGRLSDGVKWIEHISGVKWIAFCRNNVGNVRKYRIDQVKSLGSIDSLTSPLFSMEPKSQSNGAGV